jgi:hypothetical protein
VTEAPWIEAERKLLTTVVQLIAFSNCQKAGSREVCPAEAVLHARSI